MGGLRLAKLARSYSMTSYLIHGLHAHFFMTLKGWIFSNQISQRANFGRMASSITSAHASAPSPLCDSHCHPQLDKNAIVMVENLQATKLAVMSIGGDWALTTDLYERYPKRIIRAYGVHPWKAYKYGVKRGDTLRGILAIKTSGDTDMDTLASSIAGIDEELDVSWMSELRDLLVRCSDAAVGECGLDRSATIPGLVGPGGLKLKAMVKTEHQVEIVKVHMSLAAELQRPISLHCVSASGQMEALLGSYSSNPPTAVMLHSYGGSAESIRSLIHLPTIGSRLYFSFSTAINSLDNKQRQKAIERIRAVPDSRVLIESDQDQVEAIDMALKDALDLISEAKEWTREKAAVNCLSNFQDFYNEQ